jgi:hypothetical protein
VLASLALLVAQTARAGVFSCRYISSMTIADIGAAIASARAGIVCPVATRLRSTMCIGS